MINLEFIPVNYLKQFSFFMHFFFSKYGYCTEYLSTDESSTCCYCINYTNTYLEWSIWRQFKLTERTKMARDAEEEPREVLKHSSTTWKEGRELIESLCLSLTTFLKPYILRNNIVNLKTILRNCLQTHYNFDRYLSFTWLSRA